MSWDDDFLFEEERDVVYHYSCSHCGGVERVPSFVVEEFAWIQQDEKNSMPVITCPDCKAKMYYTGERKEHRKAS